MSNPEYQINEIQNLLIKDKLPFEFVKSTSKILFECFSLYNGFLKAERVYEANLCPKFRFKEWREIVIKAGYIVYPNYPTEPWKHFPGKKIKHFFPDFKETPAKEKRHTTLTEVSEVITELEMKIFKLQSRIDILEKKLNTGRSKK